MRVSALNGFIFEGSLYLPLVFANDLFLHAKMEEEQIYMYILKVLLKLSLKFSLNACIFDTVA